MIMGKSPLFSKTKNDTKMVRRNASDKLRLIQMVHDNPILWDSRLPNFKGAEEEKSHAWQMIGNEFSVPGRRVARAFKSLRESYRRELAHLKMMGTNFKPKWSLFMPMDFLRDVIRERKNGSSQMLDNKTFLHNGAAPVATSRNHNNHKAGKCHNMTFNHSSPNNPDDYSYFVKPELQLGASQQQQQQQSLHHHQQQQQQQLSSSLSHSHHIPDSHTTSMNTVTSTHNESGSGGGGGGAGGVGGGGSASGNNNSAFDDMELSSLRSEEDIWTRNIPSRNESSDEVEELEAIDADFPYPLILENPNSPPQQQPPLKIRRRAINNEIACGGSGGSGVGDYEGQMMHQHRHQQKHHQYRQASATTVMMPEATSQTIREVLNSKFCGFISAKLNSMEDAEADNLMNKILMLLVQTQGPMPIQTAQTISPHVNGCGTDVK